MSNALLKVDEINPNNNTDIKLVSPSVTNLEKFDNTISNDVTIETGKNALSVGPITVADGKTITVSDGSVWTIV